LEDEIKPSKESSFQNLARQVRLYFRIKSRKKELKETGILQDKFLQFLNAASLDDIELSVWSLGQARMGSLAPLIAEEQDKWDHTPSPRLGEVPILDLVPGVMTRTVSSVIRAEKEDLKEAARDTLNVIIDLNLDGRVRWVSPSWKDIVGYIVVLNPQSSNSTSNMFDIGHHVRAFRTSLSRMFLSRARKHFKLLWRQWKRTIHEATRYDLQS